MPRYIKPDKWEPIDNLNLEPIALEIAKGNKNCYVIAGPGAGKTELLAQRASFLLQTGVSVAPRKILALSYKKDAARNIADRVRKRVGTGLAERFVSMTCDAFAKKLLDHFLRALPADYQPAPDYQIFHSIIQAYGRLYPSYTMDNQRKRSLNEHFVFRINRLPLSDDSKVQQRVHEIWTLMLKGDDKAPSYLTFPMISALAEYLLRLNPKIKKALAITYSHIFLDEFQDTTKAQYSLIKTCFINKHTVLTAVGDYKQRIMLWAGADKEIFQKFRNDFSANERKLLMNYRSAPRLVEIQRILTRNIANEHLEIGVDQKWSEQDGTCEVWLFDNEKQEANETTTNIKSWLLEEGLQPRDICVIVRQRPGVYGKTLIDILKKQESILARNENDFQDLLSEECSTIILDFILLAFAQRAPEACLNTIEILNLLRGIDASIEDHGKLRQIENELEEFLKQLKQSLLVVDSKSKLKKEFWRILDYLDLAVLRNVFPQYKRGEYLHSRLDKLGDLLWQEHINFDKWDKAVESLKGENSIPIMTIHKSKGLEYDTLSFR